MQLSLVKTREEIRGNRKGNDETNFEQPGNDVAFEVEAEM